MKLLLLCIVLVFSGPSWAAGNACVVSGPDLQKYLALDYQSFDQSPPAGGWRGLDQEKCHLEVAKLIDVYQLHHLKTLLSWQRRVLTWHAGQIYAEEGLTDLALARFSNSFDDEEKADSDFKWNAYVRGSVAFLARDLAALKIARDALVEANKRRPNGNLKFLQAMVDCFEQPYRVINRGGCNNQ